MNRLLSDAAHKTGVAGQHEEQLHRDPKESTNKYPGRKRARTKSSDGRPRKRLRPDESAEPDAHALREILEEELAEIKNHLDELRAHETSLFMQLTTGTLPASAQTQQAAPSSSPPLPCSQERSTIPRSPNEKATLDLAARERELCLERAVRLATKQTLEDVQREIKSPHVLYMLMGALECL
ncbi:uncharacterized protein SCHCODRAFT_01256286 [Schizophyllum commune H4-8]|uniref:uncharacterized protein n=1 Tax=Schizophyllum commune (strain H4-8 / FGSC 9210) TaxID=578458 RepID=UPI00215DFAE1|nr:uncharacterized protein SCHCODRAFT_01256286 [Schizophyllum commune H4-8]KAI5885616.1 hypothetical protein SCHCODRAFT_01256286 [Schizophyllum commune H4-8]